MPIHSPQSEIKNVRDQLFIDTAEGKYLNALSANLGINRPIIGFTDRVWRAIVKQIALDHKQIWTQFRNVLAIILGPQVTQVASLAQDAVEGEYYIYLNEDSHLPQTGTLVLDEGSLIEETLEYELINRDTHRVTLVTPLAFTHTALLTTDFERPVWGVVGNNLIVSDTWDLVPLGASPYPVVLNRGTAQEEVRQVVGLSGVQIEVDGDPITSVLAPKPTLIYSTVSVASVTTEAALYITDVSKFPSTGYVRISAPASYTAGVGSTTSLVVVDTAVLIGNVAGYELVFTGNVTAGLANARVVVALGYGSSIYVTDLPFAPAAGDTFAIVPRGKYISVNYDSNYITLEQPVFDLVLPVDSVVEVLTNPPGVSFAQVQVKGTGWDVYQTTPRRVHLYIPDDLQEPGTPRSASYLHNTLIDPNPATTLVLGKGGIGVPALLDELTGTWAVVADPSAFPGVGVVTFDPGGATELTVGYYKAPPAALDTTDPAQALTFTSTGGSGEGIIARNVGSFLDDGFTQEQLVDVTGTASNDHQILIHRVTTTTLSFTNVSADPVVSETTPSANLVTLDYFKFATEPDLSVLLAGISVELYQQAYPGTSLISGDIDEFIGWPGPYVYNLGSPKVNGASAATALDSLLAGPFTVVFSQVPGNTALEVDNAIAAPVDTAVFPYDIQVGAGTGNNETLSAAQVSLKDRVNADAYEIDAAVSVGDTEVVLASVVSAFTDLGADIPVGSGYRLVLSPGTVRAEVVYVTGVDTGTFTLTFESPCLNVHNPGDLVALLADVVIVEAINDDHPGKVTGSVYRSSALSTIASSLVPPANSTATSYADKINILYSDVTVQDTSSFSDSRNGLLLNYGPGVPVVATLAAPTAPGNTVDVPDASLFPLSGPFIICIDPGKYVEEWAVVLTNDVGPNQLVVAYGLTKLHDVGAKVVYTPGSLELVTYTGTSGFDFTFSTPFVVQYTHNPGEPVILTNGTTAPKRTGHDYPFRLPPDVAEPLKYVLDLLRAAGVKVEVVRKR